MHPKSFVSNFWGAVHISVAPLFSVLYICWSLFIAIW